MPTLREDAEHYVRLTAKMQQVNSRALMEKFGLSNPQEVKNISRGYKRHEDAKWIMELYDEYQDLHEQRPSRKELAERHQVSYAQVGTAILNAQARLLGRTTFRERADA